MSRVYRPYISTFFSFCYLGGEKKLILEVAFSKRGEKPNKPKVWKTYDWQVFLVHKEEPIRRKKFGGRKNINKKTDRNGGWSNQRENSERIRDHHISPVYPSKALLISFSPLRAALERIKEENKSCQKKRRHTKHWQYTHLETAETTGKVQLTHHCSHHPLSPCNWYMIFILMCSERTGRESLSFSQKQMQVLEEHSE